MDICVYGASGDRLAREYFDAEEKLGELMGKGGHRLIFGGGQNGLMGACARGVSREKGKKQRGSRFFRSRAAKTLRN